jgi:hypothetical protein
LINQTKGEEMSKEEHKQFETIVRNLLKFLKENSLLLEEKKNNRGLHFSIIDSFHVEHLNKGQKRRIESCFGVGQTKESARFDLATLIEGDKIFNPYTEEAIHVPLFDGSE